MCQCAVVTCVKAWLDHVQIKSGPVFRRIENTGQVGERSLHPQEVARILQRIAQRMNAESVTWPDLRLGAHSTLIGAAHDMVAAGIDLTSIMHAGGWNDPKMPRYYTRELAAMDSGMARLGGRSWYRITSGIAASTDRASVSAHNDPRRLSARVGSIL